MCVDVLDYFCFTSLSIWTKIWSFWQCFMFTNHRVRYCTMHGFRGCKDFVSFFINVTSVMLWYSLLIHMRLLKRICSTFQIIPVVCSFSASFFFLFCFNIILGTKMVFLFGVTQGHLWNICSFWWAQTWCCGNWTWYLWVSVPSPTPAHHEKVIIHSWHHVSLACILALSQEEASKIKPPLMLSC